MAACVQSQAASTHAAGIPSIARDSSELHACVRGSKAAIQRRSSMPPEEPCPGQTCVSARVRMPVELMTAAGVGAGDNAGAGDGAGTGGERGAGGVAGGQAAPPPAEQAAPPPAELAAALWSLANGLLHYGRDLLRVAIPLPHPVTDAAALHLVLWLATALAVLPWRWRAIEAAGTADADQLRRLEWAAAIAVCTCGMHLRPVDCSNTVHCRGVTAPRRRQALASLRVTTAARPSCSIWSTSSWRSSGQTSDAPGLSATSPPRPPGCARSSSSCHATPPHVRCFWRPPLCALRASPIRERLRMTIKMFVLCGRV